MLAYDYVYEMLHRDHLHRKSISTPGDSCLRLRSYQYGNETCFNILSDADGVRFCISVGNWLNMDIFKIERCSTDFHVKSWSWFNNVRCLYDDI